MPFLQDLDSSENPPVFVIFLYPIYLISDMLFNSYVEFSFIMRYFPQKNPFRKNRCMPVLPERIFYIKLLPFHDFAIYNLMSKSFTIECLSLYFSHPVGSYLIKLSHVLSMSFENLEVSHTDISHSLSFSHFHLADILLPWYSPEQSLQR